MRKKLLISFLIIFAALSIIFPLKNNAAEEKTITINQPIDLNYKSKQEIYDIRKYYVKNSIFAAPNYEPSEDVFGGIEDNKPWIAMNMKSKDYGNYEANTAGPSTHSRSIINPSLPVMIDFPFSLPSNDSAQYIYNQIPSILIPLSAKYSEANKEVEITYRPLVKPRNNGVYQITAINARDFGYKYMYLDKSKSTLKLVFMSNDNISNSVKEITDFIHKGDSCGVQGGCNNWSIMRDDLQFVPLIDMYQIQKEADNEKKQPEPPKQIVHSLNVGYSSSNVSNSTTSDSNSNLPQLYIKLWKNRPSSSYSPADLNVRLIFERPKTNY